MPANKTKHAARLKRKRANSQLNPTSAMDSAGVPTARHALMAARLRVKENPSSKHKKALIIAEKDFISRVNIAKKRKVKKQ